MQGKGGERKDLTEEWEGEEGMKKNMSRRDETGRGLGITRRKKVRKSGWKCAWSEKRTGRGQWERRQGGNLGKGKTSATKRVRMFSCLSVMTTATMSVGHLFLVDPSLKPYSPSHPPEHPAHRILTPVRIPPSHTYLSPPPLIPFFSEKKKFIASLAVNAMQVSLNFV